MTEKEDELDFENFREKDAIVLQAVAANDGEADTKELIEATGLNHQEIAYRYEKFEDRGLLKVRKKADDTTPGLTMNEVRLTEKGRQMLDSAHVKRLLGGSSDRRRVKLLQMESKMRELDDRLGENQDEVDEQAEQLSGVDGRLEDVENTVNDIAKRTPRNVSELVTIYEEVENYVYDEYVCQECENPLGYRPAICPECGKIVGNSPAWNGP